MMETVGEPARGATADRVALLEQIEAALVEPVEAPELPARLLRVLVPEVAEWGALILPRVAGVPGIEAAVHRRPSRRPIIEELRRRVEGSKSGAAAFLERLAGGQSGVLVEPAELARLLTKANATSLLEELDTCSLLLSPLRVRGELVGALCLGFSTQPQDARLAVDAAAFAGLAVQSAWLHEELRVLAWVRDDVLAVVSHDLKTPLAAIRLGAQLLSRQLLRVEIPERARRQLLSIERSSARMASMLSELFDLARVRSGTLALSLEDADLGELVDEVVRDHEALASERGLDLRREGVLHLGCHCDPRRVREALAVFVGNALKHSNHGRVIVDLKPDDAGNARVTVTDEGVGIAPASLDRFLGRAPARDRKRGESRGLSLFVARGLLEAHGGHLEGESEQGHGTCFILTLPLARPAG
jgi:signal transduction histidine kinase